MPANCGCKIGIDCNTIQSQKSVISVNQSKKIGTVETGSWRYMLSSDRLVLVEIVQRGMTGGNFSRQRWIAPNSAIEIQGHDSVDIYVTNVAVSVAPNADSIVYSMRLSYIDNLDSIIQSDDPQSSLNGAWELVGSNNGYLPNFATHLRIYCDQQIRIRGTDAISGNIIEDFSIQPQDEIILKDLLIAPQSYWEVRQSVADPITPARFRAIWFRLSQ